MATATVVAVYGVPAGQSRVRRLGGGMLAAAELVVVDPPLDKQLAAGQPPRVLRVALGSVGDGKDEPFVELREVSQVLESVETRAGTMWALTLEQPAKSPTIFGRDGPPRPRGRDLTADELADLLRRAHPHRPDFPVPPHPPRPPGPHRPHGNPETLWCRLFPNAWFCRRRG